jgi:hypothetical protein
MIPNITHLSKWSDIPTFTWTDRFHTSSNPGQPNIEEAQRKVHVCVF